MAFLFLCDGEDPAAWKAALQAELPDLDFRIWPDAAGNVDEIDIALAWQPPPGLLATLPRLKAILSLGAGVEHVLRDGNLPAGVPLARLVDPGLRAGMIEFVTMEVLRYHRREPEYRAQQAAREWRLLPQTLPGRRRIGILGLGYLGRACAEALRDLGFSVAGWSRSRKSIKGVESLAGEDGLFRMLERSEILICLLPLTPETEDILDATTLGALPAGAVLINAARGAHLVDQDLLHALDSEQLSYTTLDVFREEPLPPDHPFWAHPRITLYPHSAAWSLPESGAAVIAENVRRALAGQPLVGQVDLDRGY